MSVIQKMSDSFLMCVLAFKSVNVFHIYNENIYIYGFQSISFLWPTCLHEDIYLQCIALTLQNLGLYDEFHNPLWLFHVAMNCTYVLSIQNNFTCKSSSMLFGWNRCYSRPILPSAGKTHYHNFQYFRLKT